MPRTTNNDNETRGVLAALRALAPQRQLTFLESLKIAELQAARLRELLHADDDAFPTQLIAELSRIRVVQKAHLPVSGASYWSEGSWIIALNASEPWQRRRLTALHEFKHIIDHGRTAHLYAGSHRVSGEEQAEQAADYFAGCVLVPKRLLKRAFGDGVQKPAELAEIFAVSEPAIRVRLAQVGLTGTDDRCNRSTRSRGDSAYYFRTLHPAWPRVTEAV